MKTYASFWDFYPVYLEEHRNRTCRRLHFIGSWLVLAAAGVTIVTANWRFLLLMPLFGYGFAWGRAFCIREKQTGYLQTSLLQPGGRLGDVRRYFAWQDYRLRRSALFFLLR